VALVEFVHDDAIPAGVYASIEASFSRGLPRFHRMAELGADGGTVALVGGGPSLRAELDRLRSFTGTVISCGTVHDYLIENSVPPDFHVDGEPDADGVMPRWLKHARRGICYLIASQCPATTFDALAGCQIMLWHSALRNEGDGDTFHGEPAVPGGCANLLRAWPIAAIMGFKEMHFFGFDCSFDTQSQHAYAYDWTLEEPCAATCKGDRFLTAPGWLAQLNAFLQMVRQAKGRFAITVHGHSLAAKAMEMMR
jgi:hypothetical protein